METARIALVFSVIIVSASFAYVHVYGERHLAEDQVSARPYHDQMQKMQDFKATLLQRSAKYSSASLNSCSPSAASPVPTVTSSPRVYRVTPYGADPTGKADSTEALLRAISDALQAPSGNGFLIDGVVNLGGAQIYLEGGNFLISRPLKLPVTGRGNFMIHGGTIKASGDFPRDGYLLDLSASPSKGSSYNYEFVTLRDLLLDSNFRSGGIKVVNSLRTSIDNCYITHFTTNGILVQDGHETYIRNTFLGQHITAGGDRGERNFSGTAINLMGNDNAVTDVVIFSAAIGIMVSGQANVFSGVHCYNKATGFGGTGIYLKLPGFTQTRIVNSYLDFTGIVAEDPVQLHISNCLFLGDAYVVLKSIHGVVSGLNIVENMFSGSANGVEIVQLDQTKGPFKQIHQVVIDRNNVNGMNLKATIARGDAQGNGTQWRVDLSHILVFPNLIRNVQYTVTTTGSAFPKHALRNVSNNQVLIETDKPVPASVFVVADQGQTYSS